MRWLALVRNVMVGREGLDRGTLLRVAKSAGCADVSSHLATGNLTFQTAHEDADLIAHELESGVEEILGRPELVAVRPLPWLLDFADHDWFGGFDPSEWELEVAFLRHDAPAVERSMLENPRRTVIVDVHQREVLSARPRTGGSRPHVNRIVERATRGPATARGWTTLQRIAAKA